MPWNAQSQLRQGGSILDYVGDTSSLNTAQQLQALLQLQQQQQQRQHNPLVAFGAGGHLGSLSGLAGMNPSVLELAALAQQQHQQQHHVHQQPQQQATAEQLALQQLLGLGGDSADTLALLRRAMNNNRQT